MSTVGISPVFDEEKMHAFLGKVVSDFGATFSSMLSYIGIRLGLYEALADSEGLTPAELAAKTGASMPETLEKAIDTYYREQFQESVNRAYAALRANPKAWAEELAERRALEGTLSDGLEDA